MKKLTLTALFLLACSKPTPPSTSTSTSTSSSTSPSSSTSTSTSTSPSTSTSSSTPWSACAEPKTLTQLGTLRNPAHFDGELLVTESGGFDPETLASKERPSTPTKPKPGQTPSRYTKVVGGKGLVWHDEDHATVEDATTHKVILTAPVCAAGGTLEFDLSTTGRFLICVSGRTGLTLWDLTVPHPSADKPALAGNELWLAPNDAYALTTPVLGFGTELPTSKTIDWFDFNGPTHKSLGPAPIAVPDKDGNLPKPSLNFGVAFCGDGALFVVAESKELGVYRGSDAQKLASAPSLQGGDVSFSTSGRYVSQTRNNATTVYRLDR